MNKEKALVLKFGGSGATTIEGANVEYLTSFLSSLVDVFSQYERIGLIIGGGPRIRSLQKTVNTDYEKNMIAREALWEHAEQLLDVIIELGLEAVPVIPHSIDEAIQIINLQLGKVVVLSWLKEGQSTDASAIFLADEWQFQGYEATIVILSNVTHIFTSDPKIDPQAKSIQSSNVKALVEQNILVDDPLAFKPGMNVTIDPVAVAHLLEMEDNAPKIFFGDYKDAESVRAFLLGLVPQNGTILSTQCVKTIY
ncbi:hypothetical protein C5B42_00575 [Candidatus Cerribacteria bacterium 'Amazon FNV 2010 28 9']|uniref:Aspartate/glutamate/uridylate kinase domain-containing protein n=1 Tax=Candidatus Cerribacteria bacterium 'Amazon FNV 2010 28 9' TaxID=2081795 RepID=A0A317JQE4_9BACT|nr:MAG: hypothetical protein C5B42_00575 [Candidatus Cerribacteria bacterium 'Amazon FNV 2010 28 9']